MMPLTTIYLVLLLILNIVLVENVDYCNRSLCRNNREHIACGNDGKINSKCADYSEILELTPKIQSIIIRKHNECRNKLALGQIPDFETANRMATMEWNDELASMADLNVKSCTNTHDHCRNTYKFPFSGQNIGRRSTPKASITVEELEDFVVRAIDRWFKENEICPKDGTTVYTNAKKMCGHFTVMIAERNNYLGCAVLLKKRKKLIFTCNYSWTNVKYARLYKPGAPASSCKTGINKDYSGLCSTMETYE